MKEEKMEFVPLASEMMRDYRKELEEELESLDVFEDEIIEIQKKIFGLQRLIQMEKIHIRDFLGERNDEK